MICDPFRFTFSRSPMVFTENIPIKEEGALATLVLLIYFIYAKAV